MKHPRPPAEAQIEELLTTARNNIRITVELPFNESAEPYMLSSFVESAKAECFWMFYRGVGPDSSLLWNMMTDDPGLIHHLMTSQFPALETGFSPIPKSKAVARAVANYKDVKDLQLPADSEFEIADSPAAQNFPKSAKPEHDLLTLPDPPQPALPGLPNAPFVQAPGMNTPGAPAFNPPAVPFPQAAGAASAQDVAAAAAHAAAQAAIQAAVQAAAQAAAHAATQAVNAQAASPFQPPQMQQQTAPAAVPAPGASPPNHQNLEPPPGYTPLNLPNGVHLAHTPQIPLASVVPLSPQVPVPTAPSEPVELPSFLTSAVNAGPSSPAALPAQPPEQAAQPAPSVSPFAAPGSKAANTPSRGTADKTLQLEADAHTAPGRGWLKDAKGTSMVVEPVAESAPDADSPFVQPKKSPRQTNQKMKARPMLEGDLTNLQMPTLLQSINMGKMTGRLDLQSGGELSVVYFKEGLPIHCQLRNSEGENALIEAIGWDEGEFKFYVESPHHRETIKKRLDLLLMEGAALIDQSKFLKEIGVNLDSYLVRNHADITEQLFEEMVSRGAAAEMNLQKMLYQLIDNESTLEDLLRLRPMPKPRWVPVIFNLVTCSLVSFSDRPLHEGGEEAAVEDIDWPAIQAFEDSIKIAETGFLTYPAFVYHLEREYERFERFQHPFTLIILEVSIKEELSETKDPKVLQDRAVLGQLSTRIEKLKRKTDIAGHFGENQFALLLLETEGEAGRNFASRLAEAIAMNPFTTDRVEVVRLTVRLGVSSVPETCRDLGRLISLARPQISQK